MSTSRLVFVMVGIASLALLPGPRAWAETNAELDAVSATQTADRGRHRRRGRPRAPAAPAAQKGPPLPFHVIEGYGGGGITPIAYLVNPGPEGCFWGKPAWR